MPDLPGIVNGYLESIGAHAAFKGWWGVVCAVIGTALGGIWTMAVLLTALVLLDYVLGFWRAWRSGCLRRSKGIAGLGKFFFYALAGLVAALVEASINQSAPVRVPVCDIVLGYLCVNEGLSCFEHLAYFGVPLPTGLRERLREYRDTLCAPHAPQPPQDWR